MVNMNEHKIRIKIRLTFFGKIIEDQRLAWRRIEFHEPKNKTESIPKINIVC